MCCLLDISSGDIQQAPRAEIFNIQHCFVSIKDISKLLIPSLETSKSLCLFPLHFLYQICHEGLAILPLQFSHLPAPFIPGAPASFSSTGHSPAPIPVQPRLHLHPAPIATLLRHLAAHVTPQNPCMAPWGSQDKAMHLSLALRSLMINRDWPSHPWLHREQPHQVQVRNADGGE